MLRWHREQRRQQMRAGARLTAHPERDGAHRDEVRFRRHAVRRHVPAVEHVDVAGVRVVRSQSAFGFSMIYVVFEDSVDQYFARGRVLERLGLLSGQMPEWFFM